MGLFVCLFACRFVFTCLLDLVCALIFTMVVSLPCCWVSMVSHNDCSCPEIKGHAIETGRMTCKIILYTESMGELFVLGIILFLL